MVIKGLLFDLDGTIAASEGLKARALAETCRSYGIHADPRLYADVMGQDWQTVTAYFFSAYGFQPDRTAFDARFRTIYLGLLEADVTATDGACGFVRAAVWQGLKVGLVSSAAAWMVQTVLAKLALADVFDVIVTQEDVIRHKPDPAAYRLALERLALEPGQAVVFEDSAAGLQAALAAGCRCILVRHEFNVRHDFSGAASEITGFSGLDLATVCAIA
jgi:HAD superfamily hydrolase (TIGR01509 family)